MFEMEGVELDIRKDASEEIAKRALIRKTGARGLRSIIEDILLDTMYETPTEENITKVVIDSSVVRGESEPLMVYQNTDPKVVASE
jgi:ATP-dependent Clp protease ATP-binding subunit ClpX